MSGNRMLVWLAFGAFICVVLIAALVIRPGLTAKGSMPEGAALKAQLQAHAQPR